MNSLNVLLHEWASTLGDDTFWGWFITAFYGIAAIASAYYVFSLRQNCDRKKKILWTCITALLFLLGVNKQLDLQTLIIISGRMIAEAQGWFSHRRIVQEYFAFGIMLCIGAAGFIVIIYLRKLLLHAWLEVTGIAVLVGFTIIRAASINHIGRAIALEESKVHHIHAVELTGLVLILVSLFLHIIQERNRCG